MEQEEELKDYIKIMKKRILEVAKEFPGLNIDSECLLEILDSNPELFFDATMKLVTRQVMRSLERFTRLEVSSNKTLLFATAAFFHAFELAEQREGGSDLLGSALSKATELIMKLPLSSGVAESGGH